MKTYTLNAWGEQYEITLVKNHYDNNGTLAIHMYTVKNGEIDEPWQNLTVNLRESEYFGGNAQFVDTNNNGEEIIGWLVANGIAKETGITASSGWCEYPLMVFEDNI